MPTCPSCRQGNLKPGTTEYTFERDGHRLDIAHVPADVCDACAAAWVSDLQAGQLLDYVSRAFRAANEARAASALA